jgi:O-antigen/teichoic acid export membrane protein
LSSENKFVGHGITLFLDQVVSSAGNWVFWIVVSRLATIDQIGEATAIYSLVLFVSTLTQLGLEYPLLKKAAAEGRRIFGSALLIESAITSIAVVVVLFMVWNGAYHESLQIFAWMAILILVSSTMMFIARFVLLGIFKVREVFIFDIIGTAMKFVVAYSLLTFGFGAGALLTSFVIQNTATFLGSMLIIFRTIGLPKMRDFGGQAVHYIVDVIKLALVNTPSKLSRALIISLSIVLVTLLGSADSEIGIFYIVLMISVIAGSLASSIAVMLIPANSPIRTIEGDGEVANTRTSGTSSVMFVTSLRVGLCLSVPFIGLMVAAPTAVLGLLGEQYLSAGSMLVVLSISIFPQTLVMNAISQLNTMHQMRKLVFIGIMQVVVFLIAFFVLVPLYGTLGAAYAILLAYAIASVPSLLWSDRAAIRYVAYSGVAIVSGVVIAFVARSIIISSVTATLSPSVESLLMAASSSITALVVILLTRCLSVGEIIQLGKTAIRTSVHGSAEYQGSSKNQA